MINQLRKSILEKYQSSANFIKNHIHKNINYAIVAGSGFGDFFTDYNKILSIDYQNIPNFPLPTVLGHSGKLLLLEIAGKNCLIFSGRFHFYEGFSVEEVAAPSILSHLLNVQKIIFTNAAGGLSPIFNVGDCMLIRDTINLLYKSDIVLFSISHKLKEIFSDEWNEKLKDVLTTNGISFKEGVYLSTTGPTYETPAEIRFFRRIGADCVGMSTIVEASVARRLEMKVLGISLITNKLHDVRTSSLSHDDVIEASNKSAALVKTIIEKAVSIY